MAKFDILFNSGHLYSLIPNNISGHSHATAPFIDNQFDLAHVYVQIEQASAEWKLNADFSTMIAAPLLNRAPGKVESSFFGFFLNKPPFLFKNSTFSGIFWIEPQPKTHFEK